MSDLIWFKTVWHSDDGPENFFEKKKISRQQKIIRHAKLGPSQGFWGTETGAFVSGEQKKGQILIGTGEQSNIEEQGT